MATTATGNYVLDTSTFANFASWATAINQALLAFGWKQTADTGQVMWLGCSISACAMSGSNATYTYGSLTTSGSVTAFAVGMVVTITGFTGGNTGCNGTYVITGVGSGTFTVVNGSGTNNSGASAAITKQTTVPSSAYVYEIWAAQDTQAGTLPIVLKIEYGYSTSSPRLRVTVGTGSNTTGTINGAVVSNVPWDLSGAGTLANHGATTYPCYFSGDAGEFRMIMWSQATNAFGVVFGIERSKDSSGNKTTDFATAIALGNYNNPITGQGGQQSILSTSSVGAYRQHACAVALDNVAASGYFGGTVSAYPIFPDSIGKLGNPMLGFMSCYEADVSVNSSVTVASMYGQTHTFIALTNGTNVSINNWLGAGPARSAILMRYE